MIDIECCTACRDPRRAQGRTVHSYVSSLFHKGTDAICRRWPKGARRTISSDQDGPAVVWGSHRRGSLPWSC